MRLKFISMLCLSTCLLTASLSASLVDEVESFLQTTQKTWKRERAFEGPKGSTFIFSTDEAGEERYFALHIGALGEDEVLNSEGCVTNMHEFFPGKKIDVEILQEDNGSFLIEWAIKKEMCGWAQCLLAQKKCLLVCIDNKGKVAEERKTWLPLFQKLRQDSRAGLGLLPPHVQMEREKRTILADERLKRLIGDTPVEKIEKVERNTYLVTAGPYQVQVKVRYLPIDNMGPAKFDLLFN